MFERIKRLWELTEPDRFIVLDEKSFSQQAAQEISEKLSQPVVLVADINHIRAERMATFIPRITKDPAKAITQEQPQ